MQVGISTDLKLVLVLSLSLYIYIYIYMCVCVCYLAGRSRRQPEGNLKAPFSILYRGLGEVATYFL